jgi:hypothetical protein
MDNCYKFGIPNPEDQVWEYPNVWAREETTGGGSRLVIAPARNQIDLLVRLTEAMSGPLWVLYVLVVPRGNGEPGRYQSSDPQDGEMIRSLLRDFKPFLELDGRHNVWIASESGSERLIYDRHNVIYAYGPASKWRLILSEAGLSEVASIIFPSPHSHHYHQSLDGEEQRMIASRDWRHSPLRASDEE